MGSPREELIEGPNQQTTFEHNLQSNRPFAFQRKTLDQDARRDHDPENKVGCLGNGDDARFAAPEEPLHKPAHQGAFCFTATTHVFVREVKFTATGRITGAEPD